MKLALGLRQQHTPHHRELSLQQRQVEGQRTTIKDRRKCPLDRFRLATRPVVECLGEESFDGRKSEGVDLTPKSG